MDKRPLEPTSLEHLEQHELIEISHDDRGWLKALGCAWPQEQEEAEWLQSINELIVVGSETITNATPAPHKDKIVDARLHFFGCLGSIKPSTLQAFRQINKSLVPLDTFVPAQRVLFEKGIDQAHLINSFPATINYSRSSVEEKLRVLQDQDIDAKAVLKKHPSIIGMQPATTAERLNDLVALGIDATLVVGRAPGILTIPSHLIADKVQLLAGLGLKAGKVIHQAPTVLMRSKEAIQDKMGRIADLGLDPVKVVNGFPTAINIAPDTLRKKMNLYRSIARAWGWADVSARVGHIVNEFPPLLGYKPDRIRTLARIASRTLAPSHAQHFVQGTLKSTVVENLERIVAVYLDDREEIREPRDLRILAQRYRKFGHQALRAMIASYADRHDPVIRAYLRGYPL